MDDPSSCFVIEWLTLFLLNIELSDDVNLLEATRWISSRIVFVIGNSVSLSFEDRDFVSTGKILFGKSYIKL